MNRPGFCCCLLGMAAAAFPAVRLNREQRFFDTRVAPILIKRCLACHNQELKNGNISFLDRDSLLKGGSRGPAIVPGKPEKSALVDALRHDGEIQMPPGPKLPPGEIRILTEWIRRGAVWGTKLTAPGAAVFNYLAASQRVSPAWAAIVRLGLVRQVASGLSARNLVEGVLHLRRQ